MSSLSSSQEKQEIRAKMIISTPSNLQASGERIRAGDLVSFPTETVYGLGCHAMDESAVAKVFQAKERPLSDPLIVHVLTAEDAFQLWLADPVESVEGQILSALCRQFWPGPLTLVAQANLEKVPGTVMAGTGFVACRSPSGVLARALIEAARVPLAAPSANKFGHVSPTTAQHVYDDLLYEDVWILQSTQQPEEPGQQQQQQQERKGDETCQVGVESTVAKLEMVNPTHALLTVLRQGAVSAQALEACVTQVAQSRAASATASDRWTVQVRSQLKRATKDHVPNVAPGQSIRHYSPRIPSFVISESCIQQEQDTNQKDLVQSVLRQAVVIDYGQRLVSWKDQVLAYRDLSPSGDSSQAAQIVFETLRWAEQVEKARVILFPSLEESGRNNNDNDGRDALTLAVQDKLTRAASGVVVDSFDQLSTKVEL